MNRFIFSLLFVSAGCLAANGIHPDLQKSLKPIAPKSVSNDKGSLVIVTPQQKITQEMYLSVIRNNVCGSAWLSGKDTLKGISSITVSNEFGRQGYVFEGGFSECTALGELSGKSAENYVLGITHQL